MDYFYSKNKYKKIGKLIDSEIFQSFIDYMYHHRYKEIILRELKTAFPQRKFEAFLDQLIEEDLVKRENRRYYLNFPILEENKFQKEIEQTTSLMVQRLTSFSQEEKQIMLGEGIWDSCFEMENDYFYATNEKVIPISKHVAGNHTYQWISVNYQEKLPCSLANYFYLQKKQLAISIEFVELAKMIGDVNEVYYFDQVEVIIERIQANKYKNRRPSIFFDSLVLTNTVETKLVENEEKTQLTMPVVDTKLKTIDFPKLNHIQTVEEKAYIKRKVYEYLIKHFSLTNFSYMRKIKEKTVQGN